MPSVDAPSSSTPSSHPKMAALRASLCAKPSSAVPLDAQFRSLFHLKGLASIGSDQAEEAIGIISSSLSTSDSTLLKHELAYVLGQINDVRALPALERTLRDLGEHAMVRHEAAEAMGAIGSLQAMPVLEEFKADPEVSVRETCELAIDKIRHDNSEEGKRERENRQKAAAEGNDSSAAFAPIDPAPALEDSGLLLSSIPSYRTTLLDAKLPLFQRYRAMFSLRNAVHAARRAAQEAGASASSKQAAEEAKEKATAAVQALADSLDDKSALFRHEICFVFGELAHPACIPSMLKVLSNDSEHEMVRHEAAEALGAVVEEADEAGESGDLEQQGGVKRVLEELKRWAEDEKAPRVVRESCIVALDEMAYNNDPTQFQPVDGESIPAPAPLAVPVA